MQTMGFILSCICSWDQSPWISLWKIVNVKGLNSQTLLFSNLPKQALPPGDVGSPTGIIGKCNLTCAS